MTSRSTSRATTRGPAPRRPPCRSPTANPNTRPPPATSRRPPRTNGTEPWCPPRSWRHIHRRRREGSRPLAQRRHQRDGLALGERRLDAIRDAVARPHRARCSPNERCPRCSCWRHRHRRSSAILRPSSPSVLHDDLLRPRLAVSVLREDPDSPLLGYCCTTRPTDGADARAEARARPPDERHQARAVGHRGRSRRVGRTTTRVRATRATRFAPRPATLRAELEVATDRGRLEHRCPR